MFRDDAVVFLVMNCQYGALDHIESEHHIDGPGTWVFVYSTISDVRIAAVGRDENDKPIIKWDHSA